MGFIDSDSDKHNFIATIETRSPIGQYFAVIFGLNTFIRWQSGVRLPQKLVVPSSKDQSGVGVIMKMSAIFLYLH